MKYYFIIGYQLIEKHLDCPTIRVFLDNTMLDEFLCDNTQTTQKDLVYKGTRYYNVYQITKTMTKTQTHSFHMPKKYKTYEVDSDVLEKTKNLKIEVSNNNSNYTNGFVSKKSLVLLFPIWLVSKQLLHDKVKMEKLCKKWLQAKFRYERLNSDLFWPNDTAFRWPGVNTWDLNPEKYEYTCPKGGNFTAEYQIHKKHNTYLLKLPTQEIKSFPFVNEAFIAWYQHWSKNFFSFHTKNKYDIDGSEEFVSKEYSIEHFPNKYAYEDTGDNNA